MSKTSAPTQATTQKNKKSPTKQRSSRSQIRPPKTIKVRFKKTIFQKARTYQPKTSNSH